MNNLQKKLVCEYKDLQHRLSKLDAAMETDGFSEKVDNFHCTLLLEQKIAMTKYLNTLALRLRDIGIIPEKLDKSTMSFGMALQELNDGNLIRRHSWGLDFSSRWFVVRTRTVETVGKKVIGKDALLPPPVKKLLSKRLLPILRYKNVILQFDCLGYSSSWTPSLEDILADDWEVFDPNTQETI